MVHQQEFSQCIEELVKVAFPEEFIVLKKTYEAAKWGIGPCPFLGEAVVWKYQVKTHKDGADWEICVTIPLGSYTGGEALFPDLNLKFM